MRSFDAEFRLEPTDDHPAPFETAQDLAEHLDGEWCVFNDPGSGDIFLVTEGDDAE